MLNNTKLFDIKKLVEKVMPTNQPNQFIFLGMVSKRPFFAKAQYVYTNIKYQTMIEKKKIEK